MDHINGRTMTHWKLSEGNIEVFEGKEDDNRHLMSTIDFYKTKIEEMKEQHKEWNLFDEKQKYDSMVDQVDGQEWQQFKEGLREDAYKIETAVGAKPVFEDTMIVDTIKAMRRDRKEIIKREAANRKPVKR